jgi:hypothetical protein
VSSPGDKSEIKKKDRKHIVEAEQVPVNGFKVNGRAWLQGNGPMEWSCSTDPASSKVRNGSCFSWPSANAVDKPLLLAVPFVAPSN